ncbi:hypothetical protein DEU56DRAFT_912812 [Suillus clintonianus]|uniref:uncharacterized protein n=1 Tax=Suillus clintonianus TaxID=1904413 RepID=UPI001B886357|nr:uncharacterized protein DEU56DRAFT_912812 [Suillus clintonianus]KAG2137042.1 hypothetical protein DEU56DRAFT_912812 [Suillus clintonianus]
MPRRAPLEDAEDFTAEIDAVEDTCYGSDDDSERDSASDAGSDLGTLRRILMIPQPDAPMLEVRKALEIAQQAYNTVRSELRALKRDYATLQAAIPARSRNKVLKKTSAVDSQITRAGKKYAMFHYFWVMNGLFPTTPQPNIDPRSDTRWTSPEAKLNGAMAELYHCVPKSLHKAMENYSQFGSLFRAAVSSERSNILHSLKDCAGLIYSSLKLDPTVFTDGPAEKKENEKLLALLKKHGGDEYTRLAPILFMNPAAMVPDDFLKTPIMVKIIRVEILGKASLSGKTKGHPKARGQRWDTQCVTEGLIAGAAIVAHFLLTHDQELTATGSATKIEYGQDYDFYLERLFKRSSWAISVMDYYNREVFGASSVTVSASTPSSQPRTWEDNFLQQLDAPAPALAPAPAIAPTLAPTPAPVSTPPVHVVSNNHTTMSISHGLGGAVTSTTTQLQVDIGQLSLENDSEPSASSGRRSPAARQRQTTGVQPITQPELYPDADPIIPLAPPPAKRRAARGRPKKSAR